MELRDIKNKILQLENQAEYYIREKELLFLKTQPRATDLDKMLVDGTASEDKYLKYIIEVEERELDLKINTLKEKIKNAYKLLEKELKRLDQYNEAVKLIVFYRDLDKMKWEDISQKVHYSESHCRYIYSKTKNKQL